MLSSGVEDLADETSIWRSRGFQAYLGSTAFSGMALAMQQLLFSWILIGILELPADQVGLIQGLIGIPGIFLMLIPLFSAAMAIFFFKEEFQLYHFIGSIFVIIGLFLANKKIKNV